MSKMTYEEKVKKLICMLLTEFVALVAAMFICLLGILVAENYLTTLHWIMFWGFVVITGALKVYAGVTELIYNKKLPRV